MEVKPFPTYISATPKLLADLDNFDVENVVSGCGQQVPWTDFFFYLVGKVSDYKFEQLVTAFAKKAREVGEELIDAFLDGRFEYLERFRVSNNEESKKYVKSNILFEFPNEKDKENSMKLAAQRFKVVNYFVNEKSLNRLFAMNCIALVTKCGLKVVASSLLPLNEKETLKYGIQDGILKSENQTLNNCFNLVGQVFNLKQHSIANVNGDGELLCAEVQGHFTTEKVYYLSNLTRLLPIEAPLNSEKQKQGQFKMFFLNVDLVRTSSTPLNNDCFTQFWNGNEDQRKEEEGNIRKVTDLIYSTLIPDLAESIQNGTVKISHSDKIKDTLHKRMLSLHHLPYLIEKILASSKKFSSECEKTLSILLIELFSRVLKWKWYSLMNEATNKEEKQKQTLQLKKQFFAKENERKKDDWIDTLKIYCEARATRLNHPINQFIRDYFEFLTTENLEKILMRFSELCGIDFDSNNRVKFRVISKRISLSRTKSLDELMELKKERERLFGKLSMAYALIIFDIARCYRFATKNPNPEQSLQHYQEWLKISEINELQNHWHSISISILEVIGITLQANESYKSCPMFKSKIETVLGVQHPECARLFNVMGISLTSHLKYEEAMKQYEEALKIYEQTIGKYHPSYLITLTNVAIILKNHGKVEKSLEYFKEILELKEKSYGGKQHPSYAQTLTSTGTTLNELGRFDEALQHYEECLKIQESTNGKTSYSYVHTLSSIGMILEGRGRYDEALKYYQEALVIRGKTIGKQHQEYALNVKYIAGILHTQANYEEALKYFEWALAIEEKTLGKKHAEYADTLANIGTVLKNQGLYDECFKYFDEALKIVEQTVGKEHPDYAITLGKIGSVYLRGEVWGEAERYLRECMTIQEKTLGRKDDSFATTLFYMSEIFEAKGKLEEALNSIRECIELDEKICSKADPKYALDLMRLASILGKKKQFPEAIQLLRESQSIMENSYKNKEHPDIARVLFILGQTYRLAGNEPEAIQQFQKSLSIREKKLGKQHPLTLRTQSEMEGIGNGNGSGLKMFVSMKNSGVGMPMFIQLFVDRCLEF